MSYNMDEGLFRHHVQTTVVVYLVRHGAGSPSGKLANIFRPGVFDSWLLLPSPLSLREHCIHTEEIDTKLCNSSLMVGCETKHCMFRPSAFFHYDMRRDIYAVGQLSSENQPPLTARSTVHSIIYSSAAKLPASPAPERKTPLDESGGSVPCLSCFVLFVKT